VGGRGFVGKTKKKKKRVKLSNYPVRTDSPNATKPSCTHTKQFLNKNTNHQQLIYKKFTLSMNAAISE